MSGRIKRGLRERKSNNIVRGSREAVRQLIIVVC